MGLQFRDVERVSREDWARSQSAPKGSWNPREPDDVLEPGHAEKAVRAVPTGRPHPSLSRRNHE